MMTGSLEQPPIESAVAALLELHQAAAPTGPVDDGGATQIIQTLRANLTTRAGALSLERVRPVGILHRERYTTSHCLNVAILAMSAGDYLGFGAREVAAIGVGGLLHDIGHIRIPKPQQREDGPQRAKAIEGHTVEGARLLLGSAGHDRLPAVVAYEHHMGWQGDGGHPAPQYPRKPHRFSRLVAICDAFDTLRTPWPKSDALSTEAALAVIEARAGEELDPDLCRAFLGMMRGEAPPLLPTGSDGQEQRTPPPALLDPVIPFDPDLWLFAGS